MPPTLEGTGTGDEADTEGEGESDGDGDGDGDGEDEDDDDGDDESGDPSGDGDPGHDPDEDPEDEPCASLSESANLTDAPADIIFIVDNSGSMDEEAIFVREQMNGFSTQIGMSGIDYHVVLISSYPGEETNGICIEPPLGGGACPIDDNNLPVYRHVNQEVESHDALEKLVATHGQWKDSMRPNATKHVVVISDDESDVSAVIFSNQFKALDPSYGDFVFHGIVCPWECEASDGIGQIYMQLVNQTGGVLGDLCAQDFQTVFDELAKSVIENAPLSCQFEIPPPPMGMSLDPELVNVELGDGNNVEIIPRVMNASDCMNYPDGWYYDDPVNPTHIFLCPQTCEKAQGYAMGSINVQFGCDTVGPVE